MVGNGRWKRLNGLLFVLLIWGASAVLAAVPAEINYQGSIEDLSGPVDGTLTLTFRLFDADVAGTIAWEEVHSVLVNQGVYNVILGTGTLNPSYGSLEEAVFGNDDLWLEVQVAGDADAMAPRQKITSVGFAMRAGSVSEGTITATMLADDAVTTDKLVDGAVTAAKVTGGFVPNLDADQLDGHDTTYFATATTVTALQNQVATLQSQVDTLVAKLQYLTVVAGTVNQMPGPHVMITGANLHVRSGSGSTDGTINGLGNLIVGYNELRGSGDDRTGSHNIVTGQQQNYTAFGGLVAGVWNTISGIYASVSGGYYSTASGNVASVSGGTFSDASGYNSSISGGFSNTASGESSSVSGGQYNTASGFISSVNGGRNNIASGISTSVSGGGGQNASDGNEAFANYSAILGGRGNVTGDKPSSDHTIGRQSTVTAGSFNTASGYYSSVSGGTNNSAVSFYSSVNGGRYNIASGNSASVSGGGGENASDGNEAFANYSAILGGTGNVTGDKWSSDHTIGPQSTVSGGWYNIASGIYSSVSGGHSNYASSESSSVSGGYSNEASGSAASVSGGEDNTASGHISSVSGGDDNTASGWDASVSGGAYNEASGYSTSVSGGAWRSVSGNYDWRAGGYFQDQ